MPTAVADMTTKQVAKYLGISEATVRWFTAAKKLRRARKIGTVNLYDPAVVKEFKERNVVLGRKPKKREPAARR